MLVARSPQKNTYELTYKEIIWMEEHKNDNPFKFIRGVLKYRFENYSSLFTTRKSLAEACIEIAKLNSWVFKESIIDNNVLIKLNALGVSDLKQTIVLFRDLWRGYTDEQVIAIQSGLIADRERLLKLISSTIRKNEIKIAIYGRKKKQITVERLQRNHKELINISKLIQRVYSNSQNVAQCKLYYQAFRRRQKSSSQDLYPQNDYLGFERKIHSHDPQKMIYPLRFLGHMPAKMYDILESKWQKGLNREELILSFEDAREEDNSFFDNLRRNSLILFENLRIDRISQVAELEVTYSKKCYTASALLAVTLVEGILWDYASYLNKKRIKIFLKTKGKYYPYVWDYENNWYKCIVDKQPVADAKYLTSARQLLMKTRLGNIIPIYLYDYLIDEFYDERNDFAHGYFAKRNMQVEAIAAILCFNMFVLEIDSQFMDHKYVSH